MCVLEVNLRPKVSPALFRWPGAVCASPRAPLSASHQHPGRECSLSHPFENCGFRGWTQALIPAQKALHRVCQLSALLGPNHSPDFLVWLQCLLRFLRKILFVCFSRAGDQIQCFTHSKCNLTLDCALGPLKKVLKEHQRGEVNFKDA